MVILKKTVPNLTEAGLTRFVARAARTVRLRGGVNILVTTSRELQRLNLRFRGKDKPTDVLSFPPPKGIVPGFAGDIAISADIAAQNAHRLGHTSAEEIKILVLHGILHLAGYNHETDHGEMARKEQSLRQSMKLPCGLIERNTDPMVDSVRRQDMISSRTARKR